MLRNKGFKYLLLIPLIAFIIIFKFLPLVYSLINSLTLSMVNGSHKINLENYLALFKDKLLLKSIVNSIQIFVIYIIIKVPLLLVYSTIIASFKKSKKTYLSMLYLPSVVGGFAFAIIFRYLFTYNGIVNSVLINLFNFKIDWFGNGLAAKSVVAFSILWSSFGISIFFMVNRVSNIEKDVVESMDMDGINFYQKIRYQVFPYTKSIIAYTIFIGLVEVLGLVDVSINLTSGGPNNETVTLGYYLYKVAFDYNDFSYASTIGIAILVITIIILIIFKLLGGEFNSEI